VDGDPASSWEQALRCAPQYVDLVRAIAPENLHLAEIATREHPQSPQAWFWLAELQASASPEQAARSYWQGLRLKPFDEQAWWTLGRLIGGMDAGTAQHLYQELDMAELSASDSPWSVEPTFILAKAIGQDDPEKAIRLYQDGLQRKPTDGVRWYELGHLLLREGRLSEALQAYLESCRRGDPGSHGCYGAGRTAEAMGDLTAALRYYRMSKWEGALQRAAELERLIPTRAP
jgi:cytochrome c-type biogenesis protein CcmH/NrfG